MPLPSGSAPPHTAPVLRKGDRVELLAAIPGHPDLRPGKQGVVLLAADELEANGLCTVRIPGRPGHGIWQLHPRDLKRLQTAPKDRRRPWSAT